MDQAAFVEEAADVCIALLNFANGRGIDLAEAVEAKMRTVDERRRGRTGPGPIARRATPR